MCNTVRSVNTHLIFCWFQVNGTSLLGATHMEAVRSLRSVGDRLSLVVCEGYDVSKVEAMLQGGLTNPLVAARDSLGAPSEEDNHS